jgi:hypothetical protein
LDWQNKKLLEEMQNAKDELRRHDDEYSHLISEIESEKSDLRNMKEGRKTRMEQIHTLAELQQPVERDTTYIVPERFPARRIEDQPISQNQSQYSSRNTGDKDKLQFGRIVEHVSKKTPKTGEVILLERQLTTATMQVTISPIAAIESVAVAVFWL